MKRLIIWMLSLATIAAAQSCDKDDAVHVSTAVRNTFEQMYPSAEGAEWKEREGYLAVEFYDAGNESEAWFDASSGAWRMTRTEISPELLPELVRQAFRTGEYGDWKVDDTERVLRSGMETLYVIEVERGREKYHLHYSEDGVLLQSLPDSKDHGHNALLPQRLPQAIVDFIGEQYPGARIVEIEPELHAAYALEVEIVDGRTVRELYFDAANGWVGTKTELRADAVPAAVMQALRSSQYGSWEIDDIDHIRIPGREWYRFEMEHPQSDRDMRIDIAPDGTIC